MSGSHPRTGRKMLRVLQAVRLWNLEVKQMVGIARRRGKVNAKSSFKSQDFEGRSSEWR